MYHLLKSLFGSKKNTPVRPRARVRPQLEALETRLAPIVQSITTAVAGQMVAPGDTFNPFVGTVNYDGVVGVTGGSGTLLSTMRHVLTAAHVVDLDDDGAADPGGVSVTFNLAGKNVTMHVPQSDVAVHPCWNGDHTDGHDFAILKLPEVAPVKGFELYRGTDEMDQVLTHVGYGSWGLGSLGEFPDSGGVKRMGWNIVGEVDDPLLWTDFDDGSADANELGDTWWLGHDFEAVTAHGDSGGPAFIGNQIAGVTSYMTEASGDGAYCTWGDTFAFGRVSSVAGWIDSVLGGGHDVTLSMSNQAAGDDGSPDTIVVKKNGDNLEIWINGTHFYSDALSQINSLTIVGSTDDDTITLENHFTFNMDVNGWVGNNVLVGPDRVNSWVIDDYLGGTLNSACEFDLIQTVRGNAQSDVFEMQPLGYVEKVEGKLGSDYLKYSAYASPVTVNLQTATAPGVGLFTNIDQFIGTGLAGDTLIGLNAVNTWTVKNTNQGELKSVNYLTLYFNFNGFENLTGGTNQDRFAFYDGKGVTGKIDGGLGTDTLDYSAYTTAVHVWVYHGVASGIGGFSRIESLIGGQSAYDTVYLPVWTFSTTPNADGSSTLQWSGATSDPTKIYSGTLTIRSMEIIQGPITAPDVPFCDDDGIGSLDVKASSTGLPKTSATTLSGATLTVTSDTFVTTSELDKIWNPAVI